MFMKIRKSILYTRLRQYFPMPDSLYTDDREQLDDSLILSMEWPDSIAKPRIGLVRDYLPYPSWTKYARFFEKNSIPYDIYPIHNQDWLERGREFDAIVGFPSNAAYHLEEVRKKYYLLEHDLGKICFPSAQHAFLYEDKRLEAYLSEIFDIPFAKAHISYDPTDAMNLVEELQYPVVSKIIPSSGSVGVELVRTKEQARKIVRQAFSHNGRKTHIVYSRQKNYVYFQDYIPNDGYDIRVIVIGDHVFGYYRKVPVGDFRASGMHHEEKRGLPIEAMRIARQANRAIKSPQLVVDCLRSTDGRYFVNELSPICQMSTLDQLQVDGTPGAYVFTDDDNYHFEAGSYWVHTLAIKEFLLNHYVPLAALK